MLKMIIVWIIFFTSFTIFRFVNYYSENQTIRIADAINFTNLSHLACVVYISLVYFRLEKKLSISQDRLLVTMFIVLCVVGFGLLFFDFLEEVIKGF